VAFSNAGTSAFVESPEPETPVPSPTEALKGTVKHSTAPYKANTKLDRDKDGALCEKS
jgi:hypothetical protein